jgi:hypothetical protein
MKTEKEIFCHKCKKDITNSYWVWYYGNNTLPTCRNCNGGIEEELKVIDFILDEHYINVILGWLEEQIPKKEQESLILSFKKWLINNPIAYKLFQSQYGEIYRLKKGEKK